MKQSNNSNQLCRLVLGTAQLGMLYGVDNTSGQPDTQRCEDLVKIAWEGGIRDFDTAQAYGESEINLGNVFKKLNIAEEVRVTTKVSDHLSPDRAVELKNAIADSISRLGVTHLFALLLHQEESLDRWDEDLKELYTGLVADGLTENIGISVYSPDKALKAVKTDGISIVQVPSNILDRRFENAGIFQVAEDYSKTIFVRSIFLQGLLLMNVKDLSRSMAFAARTVEKFHGLARKAGVPINHLALGYVREAYPHARIIFGAETPEQVAINLSAWKSPLPGLWIEEAKELFCDVEIKILNPSLWPEL